MDLDTAIAKVRDLGTAWSKGAPHQLELGEAMLLVVNAALEWQSLQLGDLHKPRPEFMRGLEQKPDAFADAARAAADHQLAGKNAAFLRTDEDERKVTAPLDTADGERGPILREAEISPHVPRDAAVFVPTTSEGLLNMPLGSSRTVGIVTGLSAGKPAPEPGIDLVKTGTIAVEGSSPRAVEEADEVDETDKDKSSG